MDWKDVKRHNSAMKVTYENLLKEAEEYKDGIIEPCQWCCYNEKDSDLNGIIICNKCYEDFFSEFRRTKSNKE